MSELIDISGDVTPGFYDKVTRGKVLGFKKDGEMTYYRIVRLDKKRRIVKMREHKLYTEEELRDKLEADA